jgi:hypothetical protein
MKIGERKGNASEISEGAPRHMQLEIACYARLCNFMQNHAKKFCKILYPYYSPLAPPPPPPPQLFMSNHVCVVHQSSTGQKKHWGF